MRKMTDLPPPLTEGILKRRCLGLAIPPAFHKGALYGCQVPKGQGTVTSLM